MPNALNKVSSVAYGGINKVSSLALASISKVGGVAYSVAAPTLDQSHTAATSNSGFGYPNEFYQCTRFTPTQTGTCNQIISKFKIGAGTLTGNVTCYIYSSNGTIPVTNLGTVGSFAASTITGTGAEYTFSGGAGASITSGTEYWIVFWYPGAADRYIHSYVSSGAYGAVSADGSSFSTWALRMYFKQYYV